MLLMVSIDALESFAELVCS